MKFQDEPTLIERLKWQSQEIKLKLKIVSKESARSNELIKGHEKLLLAIGRL